MMKTSKKDNILKCKIVMKPDRAKPSKKSEEFVNKVKEMFGW